MTLGWLVCAAWAGQAQAQTQPESRKAQQAPTLAPMTAQQIGPSAWFVQGMASLGNSENGNFVSNAGFVVTPAGVVVIDALGSPAVAQQLLQEIRRITPLPVTHVIVTHFHADHIYGLQVFKAAGARIIAHRAAQDYLNSDTARLRLEYSRQDLAPWVDAHTRLIEADEWLDRQTELVVGATRFVIQPLGPSHTPEDLVIHVPAQKLLFVGDLVFRGRIPFVGQADSRRWIQALDRLLQADAQVLVPGHGPASMEPAADLQLTRAYLLHLRSAMGRAARDLEPFEEAYRATDWSRFEHLPLFQAANRINAYNTFLLMEQQQD